MARDEGNRELSTLGQLPSFESCCVSSSCVDHLSRMLFSVFMGSCAEGDLDIFVLH